MKIAWTPQSIRAFKRIVRKRPDFKPPIVRVPTSVGWVERINVF